MGLDDAAERGLGVIRHGIGLVEDDQLERRAGVGGEVLLGRLGYGEVGEVLRLAKENRERG